ncbi:MAG: methyltransferase domain-containing protein [Burkholderiales bacterium]|nr:methyltransferase domain-containing protein [Burkholderiales bacterium]
MKQQALVTQQFGNTAEAYLSSTVHATGADLCALQRIAIRYPMPKILDLGCGAGHVSFAVATNADSVIAYDVSEQMLEVVANAAKEKNLGNIQTQQGCAESLPFADGSFDIVITRFSAHHWQDVPTALKEVHRVLRYGGVFVVIDIVAPETALYDTTLQAVELLRDSSHVRDYRVSEWSAMLDAAAFSHAYSSGWKLVMQFEQWIGRMRTPTERVQAIHSLFDSGSEEVSAYFMVQDDHSFSIDAALFEARRVS